MQQTIALSVHFENAASRLNANMILTSRNYVCYMHATDADVRFCDCPGMRISKAA